MQPADLNLHEMPIVSLHRSVDRRQNHRRRLFDRFTHPRLTGYLHPDGEVSMLTGTLPGNATASAVRRFGLELRRWRTDRGLTQRDLAVRVRYSRETIAAVEQARRYGSQELAERCDAALEAGGALIRLWPLVEAQQLAA